MPAMTLDTDVDLGKLLDTPEDILVTGGAGFIGSHVLDYLVKKYPNCNFTCIDKLSYATYHLTDNMSGVMDCGNFEFVQIDISEQPQLVDDLLRRPTKNYTTVFNLAAESCVDRSFEDPTFFTRNNLLSTQNLLESCRQLLEERPHLQQCFHFIHMSTDEVYGEQKKGEVVDEAARLVPSNPYAASKAACDLLIETYKRSYKLRITVVRSNNVYGPRQYPEKLVPRCLEALDKASLSGLLPDDKIPIHGDGSNTRRYLHVLDLAKALETLWVWTKVQAQKDPDFSGSTFNVGTNDEIANLCLVQKICLEYMHRKFEVLNINYSTLIKHSKDRNYNDCRYSIDFSRISALGWKQEMSIEQGIRELVEAELEKPRK